MKKKLIFLSTLLVVALIGLIGTTVAWLTSTGSSTTDFTVGDVTYEITPTTNSLGVIVPGQNIFNDNAVVIKNKSNVKSQLRIKIETKGALAESAIPNLVVSLEGWTKGTDGYWYYGTASGDSAIDIDAASNPTDGVAINFPLSVELDGATVGNNFSNLSYTITITFQAKQAEHVEWSEMIDINFESGI